MKVVTTLMQRETHTFLPLPPELSSFAEPAGLDVRPAGNAALQIYGIADFAFSAGELLKRTRMVDDSVSLAVALDFHTNLSDCMVDNANVIAGYRTYPHVDMYETGLRAGRTLFRSIESNRKPVMRPLLARKAKA